MILKIEAHQTSQYLYVSVDIPSHRPYAQMRTKAWASLRLDSPGTDTATALLKATVAALSHALVDSDTDQDAEIIVLAAFAA